MESKDLAVRIAQVLDKKKADSLKVLKVRDLTVLTDYFVIATGSSTTHVRSLAEEAQRWILLDYGSVILHVFCPDARKYYDLEHLWADAEPVELADLLEEADAPLTGPEA